MPNNHLLIAGLAASLATLSTGKPVHLSRRNLTAENQMLSDPNFGPIPGQNDTYNTYSGTDPPFPAYLVDPVLPTQQGDPAIDDPVWQNLLSAEWIIFSFYQSAVEAFNQSGFVDAGFPNTTYQRIREIRDNEAGHLRIFQNQISPTSVKPGACRYQFPYDDPTTFLALLTVIELSSQIFLTGLVQQVTVSASKGAMAAISQTETRHNVWSLVDIWGEDPFAGPSDTVFPYANQILEKTRMFVVPDSCPAANPEYPSPRQDLPTLGATSDTTALTPGSEWGLNFTDATNQPAFISGSQYYAVFFHGVENISVPINTTCWPEEEVRVVIPDELESKGAFVAVIANQTGAPTSDSVVAGPAVLLQQPAFLGLLVV